MANAVSENVSLKGRSFLSMLDVSREEMFALLKLAGELAESRKQDRIHDKRFAGMTLALLFEKPSLRTRTTFEIAMRELGGEALTLSQAEIGIGDREPAADIARNLSRWVDGIVARVFDHKTVVDMAEFGAVPVVNALSDLEHPCQALADLKTVADHKCGGTTDPNFKGLKLVFVGDGNNVANSLLIASAMAGMDMTVACPMGYEPASESLTAAQNIARETGSFIETSNDPLSAAEDADVIYTDVWTSMGQEKETEKRMKAFAGFQVNQALMERTRPGSLFMHCLPAHRGEEVSAEVMDGPHSVVFDEAENRLHAQKAILASIL